MLIKETKPPIRVLLIRQEALLSHALERLQLGRKSRCKVVRKVLEDEEDLHGRKEARRILKLVHHVCDAVFGVARQEIWRWRDGDEHLTFVDGAH